MNKLYIGLAGSILSLSLLTAANAADPKPEDAVRYRQSVYTVIGWHFKPIGAMMKGEIPVRRRRRGAPCAICRNDE